MVLRRDPSRADGPVAMAAYGVGTTAAFQEHRQQRSLSREDSQDVYGSAVVESPAVQRRDLTVPVPPGLPPSYADSVAGGPTASIASGQPASDRKSSTGSLSDSDSDVDSVAFDLESLQDDEEDWALDEAVPDPPSYEETEGQRRTSDELVQDVLATSVDPVRAKRAVEPLPCPVVIPQCRPGDKARGFVRAYAPVLANNGIQQAQFLAFLKSFHKASLRSPNFIAIQVSASIASFAPGVIAMAVTLALDVAARAGRDVQYRPRANHFLDRMNEEIFRPAGLYAMVIKYKQDSSPSRNSRYTPVGAEIGIGTEKINLTASHAIAKYDRTVSVESGRTLSSHMQNLRLASHPTTGAIELPRAASLIFPYLDRAMDLEASSKGVQETLQSPGVFLQDYKDRRRQNAFATSTSEHAPASSEDQRGLKSPSVVISLAGLASGSTFAARRDRRLDKYSNKLEKRINKHLEKSEKRVLKFERRLSEGRPLTRHKQLKYERHSMALDPLAEARRGLCGRGTDGSGLIGSLLSTAINAYDEKRPARLSYEHKNGSALQHVNTTSSTPSLACGGITLAGPRQQSLIASHRQVRAAGSVRRVMKEGVLYLMIVNMPSDAELAEARELLGLPQW